MSTRGDPLGPLRSPLRTNQSYNHRGSCSDARLHIDELRQRRDDRRRDERSTAKNHRKKVQERLTVDYDHRRFTAVELKLNSSIDWPIIGTNPSSNENQMNNDDRVINEASNYSNEPTTTRRRRVNVRQRLGRISRGARYQQEQDARVIEGEGRAKRKRCCHEDRSERSSVGSETDHDHVTQAMISDNDAVTDWGTMVELEEEQALRGRSLSFGSNSTSATSCVAAGGGGAQWRRGAGRGKRVRVEQKRETDELVLARRQKQIDYGLNTAEYQEYRRLVPKSERTRYHPRTPDKNIVYSRRSFDTIVRIWRRALHHWDPQPQIQLQKKEEQDDQQPRDVSDDEGVKQEQGYNEQEQDHIIKAEPSSDDIYADILENREDHEAGDISDNGGMMNSEENIKQEQDDEQEQENYIVKVEPSDENDTDIIHAHI